MGALADAFKHTVNEYGTFAVGYVRQQCRSSNIFVVMVSLFPKLWSEFDRVSWKWNR